VNFLRLREGIPKGMGAYAPDGIAPYRTTLGLDLVVQCGL